MRGRIMKKLMLCAMLMASAQAWAAEVHLQCSGTAITTDELGAVSNMDMDREFKFDEDANTAAITNGSGKWKILKDVNFSEESITGKQSGNLWTLGQSYKMGLNRYTGVLSISGGAQASLRCRVIEKENKLF